MSRALSTKDEEKARRERAVFAEFAEATRLQVDLASIQTEAPPKPDISSSIDEQKHYFELGEVTNQRLAQRFSVAMKTMQQTGGFYSQDDPLLSTLQSKSGKDYGKLDGPLQLLAYYDKQYPPPLVRVSINDTLFWTIQSMVMEKWYCVWIYSTWEKKVLRRFRLEDF